MKRFLIIFALLLMLCPGLYVFAANEGPMDEFEDEVVVIQGDANGDGKVSSLDYAVIKRAVLGRYELSDGQFAAADVNYDGKVNVLDYAIVKRVVLGVAVFPHKHDYDEVVVGNLHVFTCKGCGHQYEEFDGELIG